MKLRVLSLIAAMTLCFLAIAGSRPLQASGCPANFCAKAEEECLFGCPCAIFACNPASCYSDCSCPIFC